MALYVKFECSTCENKNCTGHGLPTTEKVCDGYKHTTTNADRIRAMTDEELAEWLAKHIYCAECTFFNDETGTCNYDYSEGCNGAMLDWLKQEVNDDNQ